MNKVSGKVRCKECGKIFSARIPKGGDGTFFSPWKHKLKNGDYCIGSFGEGEEIEPIKKEFNIT